MTQPVDFSTYQEYLLAGNPMSVKKNQPQLYQAFGPMTNMMPGIIPIPMIPMRPNGEYGGWVAADGSVYAPEGATYAMAPTPPNGTLQLAHPGSIRGSRPNSPQELVGSPKFGPGPPIVTSDRVKGPRGCNLFVFHLPNEITNWDLYLLFRRFGTILSVHTMVNKSTGLSKGFGFVSYSAPNEASAAIAEMDGFRLGKKRLKVQLKRSQDDNPDEDADNDNDSAFYPANEHSSRGGEGRGEDGRRFHSASYANFESGNTTRASTPYGPGSAPKPGSGGSDEGYYPGVDSANHSPSAGVEEQRVNAAAAHLSSLAIRHRGGGSRGELSGSGNQENRGSK